MDLSYAQIKRLNKEKKYKFSVGAYQWIQLGMFCRYEFERGCSIDDPECEACGYYNRMINMVSIVICECARFNIFWIEFKYKTKKK